MHTPPVPFQVCHAKRTKNWLSWLLQLRTQREHGIPIFFCNCSWDLNCERYYVWVGLFSVLLQFLKQESCPLIFWLHVLTSHPSFLRSRSLIPLTSSLQMYLICMDIDHTYSNRIVAVLQAPIANLILKVGEKILFSKISWKEL